ncbi:sulfatase-like hydrolase/transferase [Spongiimicrobium salis]|uniref:sulfatase-like hydrolase/transferase n=1 Tax=Spongiimicrobium salis TaxID=1667022 RepID=UPI00374C9973
MQEGANIKKTLKRKTLKDFTRLILAYFLCLFVLSIYQYIRLYMSGVLDSFINKSLLLLIIHHTGFTAVVGLFFAFLFNFLEKRKPTFGFRMVRLLLILLLTIEVLLIEYFVRQYEILGAEILGIQQYNTEIVFNITVLALLGVSLLFYLFYKITASTYNYISKMYPLTLVLFSVFLTTLTSDKKPINENKTQHLISSIADDVLDFNKYDGRIEYPLLTSHKEKTDLVNDFEFGEQRPNLVIILVDGLGADFVGSRAKYGGLLPFLDAMDQQSLSWDNYVSNTGESAAALPTLMGSLPFGKNGFTNIEGSPNRHTLFSILKNNGYTTTFNYGGNSALNYLDKFLHEERVDYILDRKSFGKNYTKQEEDAAGISLGYPDKELFVKWNKNLGTAPNPRLDVFMTLSTKKPFENPNKAEYKQQVKQRLTKSNIIGEREKKLVLKNLDVFSSFLYADDALKDFFAAYKKHPDYKNTIFIITGSHNTNGLPQDNRLDRYRVPFMMYSPLLKKPQRKAALASHADLAPTVLSLLNTAYDLKTPRQTAWLGNSLTHSTPFDGTKQIPLFRAKNNIQEYIYGKYFMSRSKVFEMGEDLQLAKIRETALKKEMKKRFKLFKSINSYVAENNKILPDGLAIIPREKQEFTKQELVWVQSVFNGKDYDNAYNTARKLAFNDDDRARALLLCRYILSKIPGHSDTEILMGRIHAWEKNYDGSIRILEEVIRKYPIYEDGYAALLDVYFWSNKNEKALELYKSIERNEIKTDAIAQKMNRAYTALKKSATEKDSINAIITAKIERYIASASL